MWPVNPFAATRDSFHVLGVGARRFLAFSFLNTLSWQMLVGSVLVLHARALGVPPAAVGLLVAIVPYTLVLSLAVSSWVDRIGARRMMMAGWTARNLLAFPLVLTPWIYARWGSHAAGTALMAGVLCFCTMRSLSCAGWFPWLHEIVPDGERGRYFSMEMILVQVVNVSIGLATFGFLGGHPALWKFGALAAVGIAAGLTSIGLMRRIPGGGPCAPRSRRRGPVVDLRLVLRDGPFVSYMVWTSLGLFVTAGQSTLVVLSLRDHLRITPGLIMFTAAVGSAAAMVVGPWWGRLADCHGSGPVQVLAGALMAVALGGFALLHPGSRLALVVTLSAGCVVSYSGFVVAASRGMLQRMRPALRSGYSAVWQSVTSVATGTSSVLVGWVLQRLGDPAYEGLCLVYSLLMAMAVVRYALDRGDSAGLAEELRAQFDAERPVVSMVRLCRYVFDPPDPE